MRRMQGFLDLVSGKRMGYRATSCSASPVTTSMPMRPNWRVSAVMKNERPEDGLDRSGKRTLMCGSWNEKGPTVSCGTAGPGKRLRTGYRKGLHSALPPVKCGEYHVKTQYP